MWVRFKHRFAYGIDRKWSHIEIPDDWKEWGYGPEDREFGSIYDEEKALGSFLSNKMRLGENHEWSDKYRGFVYEVIDNPPVDFIMKELNKHRSNIEYHKKQVEKYQKMLDELGHITKEDSDV